MKNDSPFHRRSSAQALTRREFLWRSGGGLGGIALASLLGENARAESIQYSALRAPHFAPKAKRVVQFFMSGAASHLDLFDYKPELVKRHGQPSDFGEQIGRAHV